MVSQPRSPWPWRSWLIWDQDRTGPVAFACYGINAARFGSALEIGLRALACAPLGSLAMSLRSVLDQPPWMRTWTTCCSTCQLLRDLPDGSLSLVLPPRPDGLGMSILVTSPGLLLALRADWRSRMTVALGPPDGPLRRPRNQACSIQTVAGSSTATAMRWTPSPSSSPSWDLRSLAMACRPGARCSSCSARRSTCSGCIGRTTCDGRPG